MSWVVDVMSVANCWSWYRISHILKKKRKKGKHLEGYTLTWVHYDFFQGMKFGDLEEQNLGKLITLIMI